MITKSQTTIENLYRIPENGKAELVNGEIVIMSPTGSLPNRAGGNVYLSLRQYEKIKKTGLAYTYNVGYEVTLPNRDSFSPDVSFYVGKPTGMRFLQGAPIFAVEIRSENDYGNKAEEKIKQKIKDYFLAGTKVVWDVDLLSVDTIKAYNANDLDNPIIFGRGEIAHAELALPSWTMPVDDLFE
jgi:Uma2 family endonuclease